MEGAALCARIAEGRLTAPATRHAASRMKFRNFFQAIMSNLLARTGESITGSTRTHKKAGETKLGEFFTDVGMTGLLTPIPITGRSQTNKPPVSNKVGVLTVLKWG